MHYTSEAAPQSKTCVHYRDAEISAHGPGPLSYLSRRIGRPRITEDPRIILPLLRVSAVVKNLD